MNVSRLTGYGYNTNLKNFSYSNLNFNKDFQDTFSTQNVQAPLSFKGERGLCYACAGLAIVSWFGAAVCNDANEKYVNNMLEAYNNLPPSSIIELSEDHDEFDFSSKYPVCRTTYYDDEKTMPYEKTYFEFADNKDENGEEVMIKAGKEAFWENGKLKGRIIFSPEGETLKSETYDEDGKLENKMVVEEIEGKQYLVFGFPNGCIGMAEASNFKGIITDGSDKKERFIIGTDKLGLRHISIKN